MPTKKTPTKTKRAVPGILPREPLTRKAYQAIEAYALARCKGLTIYTLLIKYVLEAERMRRADLYAWLEGHGYKWQARGEYGHWIQSEKETSEKADEHPKNRS
jgi:hypothetical protein